MQFRIGIVVWSIIAACAALTGCATGGTPNVQRSFMQQCLANAKTEEDRTECAWANADRMSGGR